jgi:hypothetical protein
VLEADAGGEIRRASAERIVKNRMLSHAERERPVTGGTKTGKWAGLVELVNRTIFPAGVCGGGRSR